MMLVSNQVHSPRANPVRKRPEPVAHRVRMKAIEIIHEDGWWHGKDKDAPGCVPHGACLVISLVRASNLLLNGDKERRGPLATEAYYKALNELIKELGTEKLSTWNDTHTKKDVLAALNGTYKTPRFIIMPWRGRWGAAWSWLLPLLYHHP